MATRRERVILELQDDLSSGMVKAAGATKLLNHELNSLSGQSVTSHRAMGTASRDIDNIGTSSRRASADINQLSGRLSLFLRGFAAVGPALAPISTVAVAGVAGLASQFGFAATGAISLVAAAQGVGDALKAVNEAALEPTAANLEKAREAMAKLGPEAQAFVTRFQEIRPVLKDIRDAAAAGWFPGLTESLTSLEQIAPEVASLFEKIGTVGGNLVAEGAAAFAGPGWADFRSFIASEAPQALDDLGRTLGNVAKGLAELWMAFGPLNSSFSSWMLDASRSFADWAAGLSETQGFQEFVEYVRTNGPKVADAAVAIANAVLQIAEAAAPLGGPVLEALTTFAELIANIADSPLGTPIMAAVTAMSALSLATNVATAATLRLKAAQSSLGVGGGAMGTGTKGALLAGGAQAAIAGGVLMHADNINKTLSGEQGSLDGVFREAVPAVQALDFALGSIGIKLPTLSEAMGNTNLVTDELISSALSLADGLSDAEIAAADLQERFTSLSAVLTKQGAFDAYQASLDNLTESIKRNGQTLDANTEKGRENRDKLNQIAESAAVFAENLEGIERKRFLEGAIRDFKAGAEAAGGLDRRAREVLRGLRDLANVKVDPKISVDTAAAKAAVRDFRAQLDGIRSKEITVSTTFKNFFEGPGAKGGGNKGGIPDPLKDPLKTGADGATVPKTGMPYADRHLYLLADGERVTSNRYGQSDKSQKALDLINTGRLNDRILGLADGGTAGKRGKRSKNLGSFLGWDIVNQVPRSLNDFINGLEASRDALQSEISAREDVAKQLGDSVTSKLTSALFPGSDVWGAGGSWQDIIGILTGGTATANMWSSNADRLRGLGLDDPGALNALLTQASPEDLANLAATATQEQIGQYEQAFQANAAAVAGAGAQAQAAQYAAMAAELAASRAELVRLNAQFAAFSKNGPTATGAAAGKAAADAGNKGAGKGARNRNRSALTP